MYATTSVSRSWRPFEVQYADWWVWVATRHPTGRWTRWKWLRYRDALEWGHGRRGAYASMQVYPDQHPTGKSKGREHACLFWLEFDGQDLAASCRGAHRAMMHCEHLFPRPQDDSIRGRYDIRYSGNRSVHLGIDLGVGRRISPSEGLTRRYKVAARAWHEKGYAPDADLGIYSEPRLLSLPGSIRFNNGRSIIRLSPADVLGGIRDPDHIIERSSPFRRTSHPRNASRQ